MPGLSKDSEAEVRSWGFRHVFTWTDGPNAYYRPHSHAGLTTHLILRGQLTIAFPDDADSAEKTVYGVGERLDVDAGQRHEVWAGPEGCTYVIGE
ncbi:cupin domain protein [Ophiostoma piceae UAMH 11346]|uniref:Cupin domain protein n=1 Tax=Ophiostoma piceae (strain UAMH 11346) TaxID=1262450 RepID=S3BTP2_OPHP1|nr:cupin domain protein [Ophiostoma piceae UAMH 11346]